MSALYTYSVDEFWQFSLRYYQIPAHKISLLWLQDHANVNINLLLGLFYLAQQEVLLKFEDSHSLFSSIKALDDATNIQRQKRRKILETSNANDLPASAVSEQYKHALAQELEMEKQQQTAMVDWFNQSAELLLENELKPSACSLTALLKNIVSYNLDCPDSARTYDLDCPDAEIVDDLNSNINEHIKILVNGYIKMACKTCV